MMFVTQQRFVRDSFIFTWLSLVSDWTCRPPSKPNERGEGILCDCEVSPSHFNKGALLVSALRLSVYEYHGYLSEGQ